MAASLSGVLQPLLMPLLGWEARRLRRRFQRSLRGFREVQERVLLEKVRRNAASDFGRDHGFESIRSVDDFRRAVPVTTYADYASYVDRVRSGRWSAMFGAGQRPAMFAMTSGTTSRPKYIPVPGPFLREYRRSWMVWGLQAFMDHPTAFTGRILQLVSAMDDEYAPCGLPCGAISGLTAQVQRRAARNLYVMPPSAARIKDAASKYYVALLLALGGRTLVMVSPNPSSLLALARAMEERTEELLRDLHDGTLSAAVDMPGAIRGEVERRLRADRGRAGELRRAAERRGALRPMDAWQMPFLGCWKGGTLSLYLREFPAYFGAAAVRDIGLIASEGRMTIPLSDEGSAGVLDGESNFFEFLPAAEGQRQGDAALLPEEVEAGREYFLLLTSSAGLYRYDIGDLVRVEGFVGGSPLVEFLNKGAHYCSLTGEKLSEHQVVESVNAALSETGVRLDCYCLAPTWGDPAPFYSLLVEEGLARGAGAAAGLVAAVDRELRRRNMEYDGKRSSGRLGPVRAKVVAAGTWQRYDLRKIAEGRRGIEQYKHKFLVNDVEFERQFAAVSAEESGS